ncbi:hypothetical protein Ga0466249_003611 [Sporomusaceae bacterium BoRhaA]|uniref:DUF2877 domain-containing protein n=1 Tax=Pelorhabdus rhamnosifermentans TaxID=2772457 RepID=UPI001C060EE9|nr:DUF2877 domain-containing protein [Pelorhabdus rhamnosifermentans]MBU2702484.1 hypothetical protein [Pelorhabdus rhamnosifermentans]
MLQLEAAAVSEDLVLPKCTMGFIKSIHHDYINLMSTDGVVSLVRSGLDHIPFGIEVDLAGSWLDFGLEQQQMVQYHNGAIVLGNILAVQGLQTCSHFSCKTFLAPGAANFLPQLRQLQKLCNGAAYKGGIMVYLGGCDAEKFCRDGSFPDARIPQMVRTLITGVEEDRENLICEGICGLLGLGPGSTPAGDDFLLGFLSAIIHIQPENSRHAAQKMIRYLTLNAPGLTTCMSVEYLKYGVRGLYHQRVGEMLGSFGIEPMQELLDKARRLMQLGHSSGVDLLVGFVYGGFTALSAGNRLKRKESTNENL